MVTTLNVSCSKEEKWRKSLAQDGWPKYRTVVETIVLREWTGRRSDGHEALPRSTALSLSIDSDDPRHSTRASNGFVSSPSTSTSAVGRSAIAENSARRENNPMAVNATREWEKELETRNRREEKVAEEKKNKFSEIESPRMSLTKHKKANNSFHPARDHFDNCLKTKLASTLNSSAKFVQRLPSSLFFTSFFSSSFLFTSFFYFIPIFFVWDVARF